MPYRFGPRDWVDSFEEPAPQPSPEDWEALRLENERAWGVNILEQMQLDNRWVSAS